MKDKAEYLDSIYKKRDVKLKQIKKRRRMIATAVPVFLVCIAIGSIVFFPPMMAKTSEDSVMPQAAQNNVKNDENSESVFGAGYSELGINETVTQNSLTAEEITEAYTNGEAEGTTDKSEPGNFVSFNAQYVRTNGTYSSETSYPTTVIINSVDELNDYCNAYKDAFDLTEFETVCKKFDDEYFEKHILAFIVQQEPSGSIRHEVTSVEYKSDEVIVNIKQTIPEISTCDMAQWHIIVELHRTGVQRVTPIFSN